MFNERDDLTGGSVRLDQNLSAFMLANCITVLTAMTMLAHSVWGCCWHHAHGEHSGHVCNATVISQHEAAPSHNACCSHELHNDAPEESEVAAAGMDEHDSQPVDGHHHGSCSETRCSFVKTSPVNVDGFSQAQAIAIAPDELTETVRSSGYRRETESAAQPRTALAVCAVTQCWLL